jgi:hypothetical protein
VNGEQIKSGEIQEKPENSYPLPEPQIPGYQILYVLRRSTISCRLLRNLLAAKPLQTRATGLLKSVLAKLMISVAEFRIKPGGEVLTKEFKS